MAAAGARFIARAAALQRHLTSATVNSNAAVREVHGAAEAWTRAESEDVRAEAARALVRALAATPSARKARALGEVRPDDSTQKGRMSYACGSLRRSLPLPRLQCSSRSWRRRVDWCSL